MSTTASHVSLSPSVLYFGTPVSLIATLNPDGSPNLAPISSSWYLGNTVVLGLSVDGQTLPNLRRERECVINLPAADQWDAVERLAPLTGRDPVPDHKRDRFRFEPRKFEAAGLTGLPGRAVTAPRVAECPVHLEAVVEAVHRTRETGLSIVETRIVHVHVAEDLVIRGTQHVDTARWNPLFYVFRHYFGLGSDRGTSFRAEH